MKNIENNKQNNKTCKKCKKNFVYFQNETWWDEHGFGYSTKLTKCPYCNCINVIKYDTDYGFDVNNDSRFYK